MGTRAARLPCSARAFLCSCFLLPFSVCPLRTFRLPHPGLTALKHPNIIRLVQHINSPQNVIMVFELAEGGDLYQFLCAAPGQRVDEEEGRSLFRQVRTETSGQIGSDGVYLKVKCCWSIGHPL